MSMSITQLAIIGPTASGKSDLAIKIASKIDAYILSIDSLSIYKEIDIVSAKPSKQELHEIEHFGINTLYPNDYFSVEIFIKIYKETVQMCHQDKKNLVIVGGTSFYLKALLDGLSQLPLIDKQAEVRVQERLLDLEASYAFLEKLDPKYMKKISSNDKYRIEKALLIYEASSLSPSEWFEKNPPTPIIDDLNVFNIDVSRELLRERINLRTIKMLEMGLIDEVCKLEQRYGRVIHPMSAIGIVEVLDYLDGKTSQEEMLGLISTHTAQLAKRQQTFNRTQFKNISSGTLKTLENTILQSALNG